MKKHWQYLKYVARHKWYVLQAGLKVKAPLWNLIVHDFSKLRPSEWSPYVNNFYGKRITADNFRPAHFPQEVAEQMAERIKRHRKDRFNVAWNHHQKRNPHHWQYWLLVEDRGGKHLLTASDEKFRLLDSDLALPMPERYVREMVADWAGAGRAITGKWEVHQWYRKNREIIILHPDTRNRVEELITEHFGNPYGK